jgi:hypothetical protein
VTFSLYSSVAGFILSTKNSTLKPNAYIAYKFSIKSMYLNMYSSYLEQKTERVSEPRIYQTFVVQIQIFLDG